MTNQYTLAPLPVWLNKRTLQFLDLHKCLVSVLLSFIHVASLHTVHHCHQVHQHIQVLLWHPDKHVPHIGATHTCNTTRRYCTRVHTFCLFTLMVRNTDSAVLELHTQKKSSREVLLPTHKPHEDQYSARLQHAKAESANVNSDPASSVRNAEDVSIERLFP